MFWWSEFAVSKVALSLSLALLLSASFAMAQQDKGSYKSSKSETSSRGSKVSSSISPADKKFMKDAAEGGIAEVELGRLAAEKASNADVKKFGQRMVDDHQKANDQLKQLAAQKHVELPQEPSAKDKAAKARLEKLSGEQFDRAYMQDMVKDHKKDVADFQRESKTATDPDVKSFASQTLPTLEDHLKQAENTSPQKAQQKSERSSTRQPSSLL